MQRSAVILAVGYTACYHWLHCVQEGLAEKGVKMAEVGAFEVIDTHKNPQMLSITVDNIRYEGNMDAVVVPYGSGSYYWDMRVGIELKQNDVDKQRNKEERGKK